MNRYSICRPPRALKPTAYICKITPCARVSKQFHAACVPCLSQLPEPLQRALKRPYRNDRAAEQTRHALAIADAICYLHLKDETTRHDFVREKSVAGDGWACETMNQTFPDEWHKIIRDQYAASKQETPCR